MKTSIALATYLPEAMLIRVGAALPLYDGKSHLLTAPNPNALGVFFHEYTHFLHNISTVSGIAALLNLIELWRCFRETIEKDGTSVGSGHLPGDKRTHAATLIAYLHALRANNAPVDRLISNPVTLRISSFEVKNILPQGNGGQLYSRIVCRAEIWDREGAIEVLEVSIGMLELLEGAAWLLEKRLVEALQPSVHVEPAKIFPYGVAIAFGRFVAPGLDDDAVIASILAALQDTDSAAAFPNYLSIAQEAAAAGNDPVVALRTTVQAWLGKAMPTLEASFGALESEFASDGIMAVTLRRLIAASRKTFEMRAADPFFEFAMIDEIAGGASVSTILQRVPSCALVQETFGSPDDVGRDVLISFLPLEPGTGLDPEDGLRTIHAVFDYLSRHGTTCGFAPTSDLARNRPCPFYTCCNLRLRRDEPDICRLEPWRAASSTRASAEGLCPYGAAVFLTRPPQATT